MKTITVQELHDRSGLPVVDVPLIDVRETEEFAVGHVPGSINLPLSTLADHLDALPEGAFDVICQSGGRSARAVTALAARGHDATNVDGGFGEWAAAGYPVER